MTDQQRVFDENGEFKGIGKLYVVGCVCTLLSMLAIWLMSVYSLAYYIGPVTLFLTAGALAYSFYEEHLGESRRARRKAKE